jgi:hypothetical protein
LETRRVANVPVGTGDCQEAFFEWLPKRVQRRPVEFGELVEKKNSMMGERSLNTLDRRS